jgi:hypothetical protein
MEGFKITDVERIKRSYFKLKYDLKYYDTIEPSSYDETTWTPENWNWFLQKIKEKKAYHVLYLVEENLSSSVTVFADDMKLALKLFEEEFLVECEYICKSNITFCD